MHNILSSAPDGTRSGRMAYIDAMRGFTMILVVLFHVLIHMSPRAVDFSPVSAILMSFRMPLFFFVSGFFAYKAVERWTNAVISDIMVRKVRAQILCATLFFMLYQSVWGLDPLEFTRTGYNYFWFTIGLFQMFAVYVFLNLVSRFIRVNITDISLILLSVAAAIFGLTEFDGGMGRILSWAKILQFFPFFAAGILTRRHWDVVEAWLNDDRFRTGVILIFVAGCFWFYGFSYHKELTVPQHLLQGILHRMAGLFTVLIFFHQRAVFFAAAGRVASILRYIGTRTLDIYMMHMFFMPHLAQYHIFDILQQESLTIFKLGVAIPVTLAIIALCLLCSEVLRSSHFLSVWLWGVRNHPAPNHEEAAAPAVSKSPV